MRYSRYWEIHLTADNGYYDFCHQIDPAAEYVAMRQNPAGSYSRLIAADSGSNYIGNSIFCEFAEKFPDTGVVASAVDLDSLGRGVTTGCWKNLVKWVSDQRHKGKIRFNCHGDAEGNFSMPRELGPADKVVWYKTPARDLVRWLNNNGLDPERSGVINRQGVFDGDTPTGLLTINLAICHGANVDGTGAVSQVRDALFAANHRLIKVTATRFTLSIAPTLDNLKSWLLEEKNPSGNPSCFPQLLRDVYLELESKYLVGHGQLLFTNWRNRRNLSCDRVPKSYPAHGWDQESAKRAYEDTYFIDFYTLVTFVDKYPGCLEGQTVVTPTNDETIATYERVSGHASKTAMTS